MRNLILLCFVAVLLSSCKNDVDRENNDLLKSPDNEADKYGQLNELQWLLGNWEHEDDGMISKEKWIKTNDDTYVGMSFRLLRSDTVFAEKMVLRKGNDGLTLTVSSLEGNREGNREGNPVHFKRISSPDKKFIFENKNHDFPQRIIYTNPQMDKIHAWIEGDVLGEMQRIDFHFTRKK